MEYYRRMLIEYTKEEEGGSFSSKNNRSKEKEPVVQINNKKDVIACHSAADDAEDLYYEPDVIDQQASMSESTRRAYYSDLQDFMTKTGRALPTEWSTFNYSGYSSPFSSIFWDKSRVLDESLKCV